MITKEEIEKGAEKYADRINYSLANADSRARAFKAGADFVLKEIGPALDEIEKIAHKMQGKNANEIIKKLRELRGRSDPR